MEHDGQRPGGEQAGAQRDEHDEREQVQRELDEPARGEKRQQGGSTPAEDGAERVLDLEPGVEWHAGEDAGEVPDRDE
jgi:hypothetical protein